MRLARSTRNHVRIRLLACAAALLAAVSACTVEDNKADSASSAGPSAASTASPGVTSDTIELGIAYPDFSSVQQFVAIDQGDYEATYNALIKKINDAGGIHGRKIVPVYGKANLISPTAAQQTCVELTEDKDVFAVLAVAVREDQALCYTDTHRTAMVGWSQSKASAARARAPWFTYYVGDDSPVGGMEVFAARGDFAGRKVAVVANATEKTSVDKHVLPALQRLGVTPVTTGYMPASAGDAAAYAQQAGVFLQKAQAEGADTLLLVGPISMTLPQILEKAAWRPKLLFTIAPTAYLADKGTHDFGILDGSVAATQVQDWNDPAMQDCVRTVEQAIPALTGKLADPATVPSGQPQPGASVAAACQTLALFTALADKAGPQLNYGTFQQAGFELGRLHIPGLRDDATYGPQTTNGAIPIRPLTYDPVARRYVPAPV
ncbi:ABC transporter substrate-binding protein [Yinghuangia sp. YIM S09857]|uniref:ABC transporter substrate-binding protein n=1 Tax=Yinghuangia sp. YIM S09857 TaxID=3436929 RepID=UPI003F52CB0A